MLKFFVKKSDFTKNVFKLMTGTVIVQIINFLSQPIITRLYSAYDYGVFSSIQAVIVMLSYVASLCYDRAIIASPSDNEAILLTNLSVKIVCVFSFICLLLLFIPNLLHLYNKYNLPLFTKFLFFAWLLFASINIVLLSLNNRFKNYSRISMRQINSSFLTLILQICFGVFGVGFLGIIISYIISTIYAVYLLSKGLFVSIFSIRLSNATELLKKYIAFPKYQLSGVILDMASLQLVVVLINALLGAEVAGQYALANKVLSVPMFIIGAAFSQVFYQEFSSRYLSKDNPLKFLLNTWKKLVILGVIPTFLLLFFSEPLFIFVFGAKWHLAGWFAKFLCIISFAMMVSSPTSSALIIIGKQRWFLFITFIYFIFRLFSVYLMKSQSLEFGLSIFIILEVFAILLYNIPIIRVLKNS